MSTPLAPLLLALFASDPQPHDSGLEGARASGFVAPSASILEERLAPGDTGGSSTLVGSFEAVLQNPVESEQQLALTVNALISLGPGLLREYVQVLGEQRLPDATPLDDGRRQALLEATELLGRGTVITFLEEFVGAPDNSLNIRRGALQMLAQVGRRKELQLALELCADENSEVVEASLRQPLCESVQALIQNDTGTHVEIRSTAPTLDPTAASSLIRAAAEDKSEDAWLTLERLLGTSSQLDRVTLTSIGQLARRAPGTAPPLLIEEVAKYLTGEDQLLVRRAITTLGAMDAQDQYEPLITLLDHEQGDIQRAAHLALVEVTGLSLPADSRRWRRWLKTENDWWRLEAPALLKQVACGQLGSTRAALHSLSRHRLRRDEIALEIMPLLELDSPELRSAACEALGVLGAKIAVPAIEKLKDYFGEANESSGAAAAALSRLRS